MKLSELKKTAAPVSPRAANSEPDAVASAPQEPQGVTTVTPSGIELYYQPKKDELKQRRLYRVNGEEVPSVTTILKVIDEPGALIWWGQGIGVEGTLNLLEQGAFTLPAEKQQVVDLLTEHKISVNHRRDEASTRGTNVHTALEIWCESGVIPKWDDFPESESGYVKGVTELLAALGDAVTDIEAEVMVGSVEDQFAGRCDLAFRLTRPVEVITRIYPKRQPKIEEIPAGRYRWDLKTSKNVMAKHHLQNEAYEKGAIECGYEATDHRAIAHVVEDGRYELILNPDWCYDDFKAVRHVYTVLNEREVLRILREDLDAQEVK